MVRASSSGEVVSTTTMALLGSAAIDRAEERKIEVLKKAGFNAIRTSHNPPSPGLLDACDRLGIVVIVEAFDMWEKSKLDGMYKFFGKPGANYTITDHSKYFKEYWKKIFSQWYSEIAITLQ